MSSNFKIESHGGMKPETYHSRVQLDLTPFLSLNFEPHDLFILMKLAIFLCWILAVQNQNVSAGRLRIPTTSWCGLGFSQSSPTHKLKEQLMNDNLPMVS